MCLHRRPASARPGGARLSSTVLMTASPAQVAGVDEIVRSSPRPTPFVPTTADMLRDVPRASGITEVVPLRGRSKASPRLAYGCDALRAVPNKMRRPPENLLSRWQKNMYSEPSTSTPLPAERGHRDRRFDRLTRLCRPPRICFAQRSTRRDPRFCQRGNEALIDLGANRGCNPQLAELQRSDLTRDALDDSEPLVFGPATADHACELTDSFATRVICIIETPDARKPDRPNSEAAAPRSSATTRRSLSAITQPRPSHVLPTGVPGVGRPGCP